MINDLFLRCDKDCLTVLYRPDIFVVLQPSNYRFIKVKTTTST